MPKNFNQTTGEQAMDHFLLDKDIIRIIKKHWKGKVDKTFYNNCPEVRDAFFSAPYPLLAHRELGYPAPLVGTRTNPCDVDEIDQNST